ncbi:MAG: hypothetical protein QOK27_2210, partial [Gemmatimonadales bacterium]|nr:hypothetical protein [Gemmatimonadales bacterium]
TTVTTNMIITILAPLATVLIGI